MKLIFISMAWWINKTVIIGLLKILEKLLHNPKVTVWCAVGKAAVIDSYFFGDNNGNAVTVNSERYTEMISNFFGPELRRKRVPIWRVWFQRDGATAHTTRASMDELRPLRWPPHFLVCWHSLDLSVLRFIHLGSLLVRIPLGMCV